MSTQTAASTGSTASSHVSSSLHGNILKESTENVFDKYEIMQVLGQGSMGYVAKVKVRAGRVGGSATDPKKKKGPLGLGIVGAFRKKGLQNPKSIEETSDHVYAIKTIQIDKVSPVFVQELENEVRRPCWSLKQAASNLSNYVPHKSHHVVASLTILRLS